MDKPFNGRLLMLARQFRRKSQAELSQELVGSVTQGTLSKIEHGRLQPQPELVGKLADALRVRPSFFYQDGYVREPLVSYHRKRSKMGARDLDALHGLAELFRLNLRALLQSAEIEATLPPPAAVDPDQYGRDAEEMARMLRQRWKLPRGPVADLTRLAEAAGIIVVAFDFGNDLVDGFCQTGHNGLPPIVFINSRQPKDRFRFSLAHEIGHLVMHQTPHPEQEVEANRFASEFLMPSRDIRPDFFDLSLTRFMDLKLYWGTSMQALIYRAWQVGALSDQLFKHFNIEMSRRGFRKNEPVQATHLQENPTTLKGVVNAHLSDLGMTLDELADLFGLLPEEVRDLYQLAREKPKLRLVKSA